MTEEFPDTHVYLPDDSSSAGSGPEVVSLAGLRVGVAFPIVGARLELGRHPACDVTIASRAVSKRHAAVTVREGACFVEDLGSTNGVQVNGARIRAHEPHRLYHGDKIRLSDQLFLFRHESSFGKSGMAGEIGMERVEEEAAHALEQWRQLFDVDGTR